MPPGSLAPNSISMIMFSFIQKLKWLIKSVSCSQDAGEKGSSVSLVHEEGEVRAAVRLLVRYMVAASTLPHPLKR